MPKLKFFIIALIAFFSLAGAKPADAQTYAVLHTFTGPDGQNPIAGLTMDAAGNLYGAASNGGATGKGTVFELDTIGKFTVLTSFDFLTPGANPWGHLILDTAGNLYGTTSLGGYSCNNGVGVGSCGTVFKLSVTGIGTVLYAFDNWTRVGMDPLAGVIRDSQGNFYGTNYNTCGQMLQATPQSGDTDIPQFGSVFKLDPSGKETDLYVFNPGQITGGTFSNPNDGGCPSGALLMDAAGNLYGTATGDYPIGYYPHIASLVFKLTPNQDGTWTRTVLHTFKGYDGDKARSELIFDAAGNLYGTTFNGGGSKNCPDGCGTVFELIRNADGTWTEKVLHTFAHLPAAHPYGGLAFDVAGNLYGTTVNGSTGDSGTVFKMSPNLDGTWSFKLLHTFAGKPAMHPYGTLVIDKAGSLYGTTADCGAGTGCYGSIFKITQ